MQDASLFVSIWPLINDNRLEVGKIKLSGMELNLMRNKGLIFTLPDLRGKLNITEEK